MTVCPTCGHCPTCGCIRQPYYQPYYPFVYQPNWQQQQSLNLQLQDYQHQQGLNQQSNVQNTLP